MDQTNHVKVYDTSIIQQCFGKSKYLRLDKLCALGKRQIIIVFDIQRIKIFIVSTFTG
jgi:hypothetical protein